MSALVKPNRKMRKTIKVLSVFLAMALFSINSYAYKITIDAEGKGSVTYEPNNGNPKYTFNCEPAPQCCGSITIEMPDKMGYNPTDIIGADATLVECNGTRENVVHKWTGKIQSLNHSTSNPNFLQVVFRNAHQEF